MQRVLIIDDADIVRCRLRKLFERGAFPMQVVGEAKTAYEGLTIFQQLRPDIVMLDIYMPEMNGIEALSRVMKINRSAKVIMITANNNPNDISRAFSLGAKGYIVKPWDDAHLLATVRRVSLIIPVIPKEPMVNQRYY